MSMFRRRLMIAAALEQQPQPPQGKYIQFEDAEVERICMANFSSDGIGVSYEDAEKVTTWDTNAFNGNKKIKYFNELRFFKNLKVLNCYGFEQSSLQSVILPKGLEQLGISVFHECKSLKKLDLPKSITIVHNDALRDTTACIDFNLPNLQHLAEHSCRNSGIRKVIDTGLISIIPAAIFIDCPLELVILSSYIKDIEFKAFARSTKVLTVVSYATIPPSIDQAFEGSTIKEIYVPDASVETYKTATGWSDYAKKIKPLSAYVETK